MTSTRTGSLAALIVTAVAAGAVAGLVGAGFIWLVELGTKLMWKTLPSQVGVDPFGSWWLFAVPIVGGALVGLGQLLLGNYPEPIERNVARWRSGGHVEPSTGPASTINSLVALAMGGPVGFEAALTGILGAIASWIGSRIESAGRLVRQAWGAERLDALPGQVRGLPYWLSAVSGLLAYRWLPFGQLDLGFRFQGSQDPATIHDTLVVVGFAAVVTVPMAWAAFAVSRAEDATICRRSPVIAGMAGGLLFATLALGNQFVLFSGQQGIQHLVGLGAGTLLFLVVAKWAALVIALLAGWRGGPIFPLFFTVSSLAVACHGLLGTAPDLVMVAGITAISAVFLRGNVPAAFVLTLYVAPFSYSGVMLVAAVASATALALAGQVGALPRRAAAEPGEPSTHPTSSRRAQKPNSA